MDIDQVEQAVDRPARGKIELAGNGFCRIGTEPSSGSIGYPLKSRECIVVDPVTLEWVNHGESGELLVSSPRTLEEYYGNPEETARTYVKVNDRIFCRIGDFVSRKPDREINFKPSWFKDRTTAGSPSSRLSAIVRQSLLTTEIFISSILIEY